MERTQQQNKWYEALNLLLGLGSIFLYAARWTDWAFWMAFISSIIGIGQIYYRTKEKERLQIRLELMEKMPKEEVMRLIKEGVV